MSDFAWMILVCVLFLALGCLFAALGWQIWKKRRLDLIIRWHCDKVKEEDKPAYCRRFGLGLLLTGIGFCLSGIGALFSPSARIFIPMTAGLVVGTALLISAVIRYNR